MRVQVTDLSLTVLEEGRSVRFAVTSLGTGRPVEGATVRLEGSRRVEGGAWDWVTLYEARTDARGLIAWDVAARRAAGSSVLRIAVEKGDDHLIVGDSSRWTSLRRVQPW